VVLRYLVHLYHVVEIFNFLLSLLFLGDYFDSYVFSRSFILSRHNYRMLAFPNNCIFLFLNNVFFNLIHIYRSLGYAHFQLFVHHI
jgi:hypothetical protein